MLHKALWDACKILWFELVNRGTRVYMQELERSFSLRAPEIICLVGFVESIGRDVQKKCSYWQHGVLYFVIMVCNCETPADFLAFFCTLEFYSDLGEKLKAEIDFFE